MNLKEIKELSSLKYEYGGSQKYDVPPLYLKGMFSKLNHPKTGEPSIFIGFVNGKNKAQQLNVFFTNTDKVLVEKNKEPFRNENTIYINIAHLSATRFPANISSTLKKICIQYAKVYDKRMKIKELEKEESKERNKFNTIFNEVNDKYTKEVEEDKSQYSPKDHIDKLIEMIYSNMDLEWGSRGANRFYMRGQIETRFSFSNLPDGFYGYSEYDGQTMIDVPDDATEKILDFLKVKANRNGYTNKNYQRLYDVFTTIYNSIKKEKYKTFTVSFEATLDESSRNDETANLEYGFTFKIKEYSDKTYKEMNDFISKYKETLNSLNNW